MGTASYQLSAVDTGPGVIPGWNRVLNRALPWFAAESPDQMCFDADARCTVKLGDEVVGIGELSYGQVLVAVDPAHRGQGVGTRLADALDPDRGGPLRAFLCDPEDPAAEKLWLRHGMGLDSGPPLILWSGDPAGVTPPSGPDVSVWDPALAADLPDIREAVRWWATDNNIQEEDIVSWQEGLPGDLVTTVVRVEGRVVGVAWAQPIPFTDFWRSTHIAVHPAHRGKGLATALKRGQAVHAAASGARGLVTVIAGSNPANRVWARLGARRRELTGLTR